MSSDLEDVIALVANRPELVAETNRSDPALRDWIGRHTARLIPRGKSREIVGAFLPEARHLPGLGPRVTERLDELRELAR